MWWAGAESREALIPMEEQRKVKNKERSVKCIFDNVEDDYIISASGNLYPKWGREVTFQVTS